MSDAPLHPRRIASALRWLAPLENKNTIPIEHYETIRHALKMLTKTQRAAGLTPELVDLGSHALSLAGYVKRYLPRR